MSSSSSSTDTTHHHQHHHHHHHHHNLSNSEALSIFSTSSSTESTTSSSVSPTNATSLPQPFPSPRLSTLARIGHYIAGTTSTATGTRPMPLDLSASSYSSTGTMSDRTPSIQNSPLTPSILSPSSTLTPKHITRPPNLVFNTDTPLSAFSMDPLSNRAILAGRGYMRVVTINPDEIVETVDVQALLPPTEAERIAYISDMQWCTGPYSKLVAAASTNGFITLYNIESDGSSTPNRLTGHTRTVISLALSPFNPHLLVSGGLDKQIKIWDLRAGKYAASVPVPESTRRVRLSPIDANKYCAVFDNGWLMSWDMRNLAVPNKRISAHSGPGFCCDYHPQLDVIATGGRDRAIRVWDMKNESPRPLPTHEIPTAGAVSSVLWRKPTGYERQDSVDDSYLASSSLSVGDYRIQVWNLRRRFVPAYVVDFHDAPVTALAWAGEGLYGSQSASTVDDCELSDDEIGEDVNLRRRQRTWSSGSSRQLTKRHRPAGTLWACSRDQRFVAHDVARSCPRKPVYSLSHQAFAWGPDNEFAFASLDKSKMRPDGLVDRVAMADSSTPHKRSGGSMVMRMMMRRAPETVPVVPTQYVATAELASLEFTNTVEPGDADEAETSVRRGDSKNRSASI
ncbi:WD40-repeat-containing domain protein [Lipomyces arxii]|uniref:WD40-repeat-containing domain protein n=1 Tax=Lipomyces arxii TaxID=56418 RepID=UPI0034CFFA66